MLLINHLVIRLIIRLYLTPQSNVCTLRLYNMPVLYVCTTRPIKRRIKCLFKRLIKHLIKRLIKRLCYGRMLWDTLTVSECCCLFSLPLRWRWHFSWQSCTNLVKAGDWYREFTTKASTTKRFFARNQFMCGAMNLILTNKGIPWKLCYWTNVSIWHCSLAHARDGPNPQSEDSEKLTAYTDRYVT